MRLEINGILRTILKDKGKSGVIKITIYGIPLAQKYNITKNKICND